MKSSPFTIAESNTTTYHSSGDTFCNASSFEDTDPIPGIDKACYCDVNGQLFDEEYTVIVKKYWRAVKSKDGLDESLIRTTAEVEQWDRDINDTIQHIKDDDIYYAQQVKDEETSAETYAKTQKGLIKTKYDKSIEKAKQRWDKEIKEAQKKKEKAEADHKKAEEAQNKTNELKDKIKKEKDEETTGER